MRVIYSEYKGKTGTLEDFPEGIFYPLEVTLQNGKSMSPPEHSIPMLMVGLDDDVCIPFTVDYLEEID